MNMLMNEFRHTSLYMGSDKGISLSIWYITKAKTKNSLACTFHCLISGNASLNFTQGYYHALDAIFPPSTAVVNM